MGRSNKSALEKAQEILSEAKIRTEADNEVEIDPTIDDNYGEDDGKLKEDSHEDTDDSEENKKKKSYDDKVNEEDESDSDDSEDDENEVNEEDESDSDSDEDEDEDEDDLEEALRIFEENDEDSDDDDEDEDDEVNEEDESDSDSDEDEDTIEEEDILDGPGALDASKLNSSTKKATPPEDDPKNRGETSSGKLSQVNEDDDESSDDSDDEEDLQEAKGSKGMTFSIKQAKKGKQGGAPGRSVWNIVLTTREAGRSPVSTVIGTATDPFTARVKKRQLAAKYREHHKTLSKRGPRPSLPAGRNRVKGVKEEVEALFKGANLTEDFKLRATTLFEVTVDQRVNEIRKQLDEQYRSTILETKAELEEQINKYLKFVVEEWANENRIAIEAGLKVEIAENLLRGMKNLFKENYIQVPESKKNILDEVIAKNDELEEEISKQLNRNLELVEEMQSLQREVLVRQLCEGLSSNDKDKLVELTESIPFTSPEVFAQKAMIIKESFVGRKQTAKPKTFISETPTQTGSGDSLVEQFASQISKNNAR